MYDLRLLDTDPTLHMDMLEVIRRETASILHCSDKGILLQDRISGIYFMTATDAEIAHDMLSSLRAPEIVALHQAAYVPQAKALLGLQPQMICHQAVWTDPQPPAAPDIPYAFRTLTANDADAVQRQYTYPVPDGYIAGRIAAGAMIGAFDGAQMAGFIGLHEEGSMGMLSVSPSYRGQGIAQALIAVLAQRCLQDGRVPFSQFTTENTASAQLHAKMGFTLSSGLVHWLMQPEKA